MWMSAQLTVQFDKKANVAVISLMKNTLHLFMEIHAVLSQSTQQIDVIHSKLHSIFSKYMATELKMQDLGIPRNICFNNKAGQITTGRNVRFACLQIYCKSCYKFQICNDLPHLHACKLLICTRGKLGGKCGNGREAVRRKSVANPLQNNYFATSLHACKFHANTKFASDLHIRKSVDYIKLANGL